MGIRSRDGLRSREARVEVCLYDGGRRVGWGVENSKGAVQACVALVGTTYDVFVKGLNPAFN